MRFRAFLCCLLVALGVLPEAVADEIGRAHV